jgi:hypothetical protein
MNRLILTSLVAVSLTIPVFGQSPKKSPEANTGTAPVSGKVSFVNDSKINVKPAGADHSTTFALDTQTSVTVMGAAKAVADITKGSTATVTPKAGSPGVAGSIIVTEVGHWK